MEKDIIDIVVEKEYIELSIKERADLAELCANEDEFNQMKDVLTKVEAMNFNDVAPKIETKNSLDDLFNETYTKTSPVWYMSVLAVVIPSEKPFIRQPLLKVAAIALLFFLAYPLVNQDVSAVNEQLAEVESEMQVDEQNSVVKNTADARKDLESTDAESLVDQAAKPEQIQNGTIRLASRSSADESNLDMTSFADDSESIITADFASPTVDLFSSGAAAPGAGHPDGVFGEVIPKDARSISAAEMPDVLDLLTSTF